jgi:WD40 repeat protein
MEEDQSKYLRLQAENLSPRPLQSLDVYSSLDANIIVAGSADKNLRFLEVETFEEIVKYEVNKKSVNCVTISGISLNGDDPVIITAGKDKTMQIWNPSSGNLGKDIILPTTEVLAIATYQGTHSFVLLGTKDSKVLLWDIDLNQLVKSFTGHRAGVYAVAITSTVPFDDINNGNDLTQLIIASGSVDHSVRTWDYSTGKRLQKFRHKRSVYSIVITEKAPQPLMVTAGAEYVIRLWDVKSAILLRTFEGHLARVNSLCLWEDYQTLVISGSGDRTLRVHDLITGECICILQGHSGDVLSVISTKTDANAGGQGQGQGMARSVIVSSSEDLSLIQWDLQQIISDFYHTAGENCGLRNEIPPYLPRLKFHPPPESDVGNLKSLSKDERRKLKKDMKRQKLLSMSQKYKRARSSMSIDGSSRSIGAGAGNGGEEDDDDDEPFVFEGLSDEDEEEEAVLKKSKGKRRATEVVEEEEDDADNSYFMRLLKGEDVDGPLGEAGEDKLKEQRQEVVADRLQEDQKKVDEISNPVAPVAVAASQAEGSSSRRSSWNRVFPLGGEVGGHGDSGADHVIVVGGEDLTSKFRKASAGMVTSMLSMIGVRSRENSICRVGVDPLVQSHEEGKAKSRAGSVSGPSGSGSSPQADLTERDLTQQVHSRATTPSDHPKEPPPRTPTTPSPHTDHTNFKHKAQNALTDYHLAQVEDQMEADKRRQEASAKLASRLKRRKTGADPSSASSRTLSSDEELVSIKEKKLMQHKLQTNRARQSMMIAKGRAAEALQKRLEEMNQKRGTEGEVGVAQKTERRGGEESEEEEGD